MASIGVHHRIRTIPARLADHRNRPAVYCVKMRLRIVTPAIISATGAGLKLVNENPLRPAPSLTKSNTRAALAIILHRDDHSMWAANTKSAAATKVRTIAMKMSGYVTATLFQKLSRRC